MNEKRRLKVIKRICESHKENFCGYLFTPQEEDVQDELARFDTRPDAPEPNEEILMAMDAIFEGGQ